MNLHTLLSSIPFCRIPKENPQITGIVNDHRQAQLGSLFICIKGHVFDGHSVANKAVESGAIAVIAERNLDLNVPVIIVKDTKRTQSILVDAFYGHPTQHLKLIGITGTNGKTTTSHLIDKICRDNDKKTGLIGTIQMKIGDRTLETKNTTPDSIVLQSVFHEMVEEKIDTAIMEVSSHALVQGRTNGCDYDIAVFTNLTQDHLDYHHTMDEYKRAKGLLFSKLGNSYLDSQPKFAVLNIDDQASYDYIEQTTAHIITYGIDRQADFRASDIKIESTGTSFTLHSPFDKREIRLQLMGKFNIYNALAAIATAFICNISIAAIVKSIENAEGVPGRFEPVFGGQDFPVIVDYAHTPDSLENVLKTISQFSTNRIITIVGCGGDRDATKRPLMAEISCKYSAISIFTSDNPRSEDPDSILQDMESGAVGDDYLIVPDRKEAIGVAVKMAEPGDVILIAGKGHETYQIIGDQVHDFDDRLVALEAIKER
ncbi:UDP-N-acetylmuramoyl-L-alanyl-D-glutamate--2,6-diaminopimelate ligase [Pseudogracilibacillus auburnensis]|uniref:UDP-N-acetylmuramoyl-L-alanyl-D-glutamate--2, 6-diaminopimelate ligase n=1 Tax=Pseudogracilibacillus auburnensis TaxID=1494959 RepID=UPI001A95E0CD|nr:UDP-N-acetylmuramoyl-L-alanyl-D-glutamate--2,6-diaminopimelate ligase [Pseudogracilibacillus auburnensis]MBO1004932.1 UDP-N-acetylmuramoyl-L-alanyl-D-glutamate--2,6-diaminopimelate ligase [Pseudogracilibacillus auburnensis]